MELIDRTIGEYLKQTASKVPEKTAILCFPDEKRLTWSELDILSDQYAKGLIALGIRKGDKLAIWASNKLEWVVSFLAAAKIGVIVATVNIHYKKEELEKLLNTIAACTLVFMDSFRDTDYVEIVRQLKVPSIKHYIHFGEQKCEDMIELEQLVVLGEKITDEMLHKYMQIPTSEEVINIQFTSGTTSNQKAVMLTHHNLVNNSLFSGDLLKLNEEDRLCLPVGFFHCFGLSAGILMCIGTKCTMVLVDCYRAITVMEAVTKFKCTALHGVPTMFSKILAHKDFKKYDFSFLRTGIVAGASCNEKTLRGIVSDMGINHIAVAYGQTEASPCCCQTDYEEALETKIHTIGKPIPYVEMKVVDKETGKDCEIGTKGELCTRGYHVMKGYYKQDDLTAKVIDKDGWLHTGDIGFCDEKGYYHISGRLKDLIIRAGENISPQEIETVLLTHPDIEEGYVYGIPDKCYGEQIAASIKLKDGKAVSEEELKNFLLSHLARYKVPKYIEFCTEFPTTASGKVKKSILKERMQNRRRLL